MTERTYTREQVMCLVESAQDLAQCYLLAGNPITLAEAAIKILDMLEAE